MIYYQIASTDDDLQGILKLQKKNLPQNISSEEKGKEGFVTVDHDFSMLKKLHDSNPHVIAKNDEQVIAYVLTMTKEFRNDIPVIIPMFQVFDTIIYKEKLISDYDYMLIGQVCVDKNFRGKNIFQKVYFKYRDAYSSRFDFAITEVAESNSRSLRAHEKIGFKPIHSYYSPDGTKWIVIIWEWK